ncbi:MAG: response regulator [Candidatus Omnitrophica bacterium]|nr:response regulator [Candidatus Omnitrophota bacterium]
MAKKVLVIDDDQTGVVLMRARLSKVGYEVLTAPNGAVGLNVAQTGRPDLIVLDIEMPQMNGYMFLMELKRIQGGVGTPVIVVTSHAENKMIFYRHGIKDYLVKPVDFDQLIAKIQTVIGQP